MIQEYRQNGNVKRLKPDEKPAYHVVGLRPTPAIQSGVACGGLYLVNYEVFSPLLNKTADLEIVEEQWEAMMRVALLPSQTGR
jgi:hypothetical protein